MLGRWWTWLAGRLTPRHAALALGYGGFFVVVAVATNFFYPHNLAYAYSGTTCFADPVALPGLLTARPSAGYTITTSHQFTIAGYPIFSGTACITATRPPEADTTQTLSMSITGLGFLKQTASVTPGPPPTVKTTENSSHPISTGEPITYKLSQADHTFTYQVKNGSTTAPCQADGQTLSCNPANLGLAQGTLYSLSVVRLFHHQTIGTVLTSSVTTVAPVAITATTIAAGSTIYTTPSSLSLTLSRPATTFAVSHLALTSGSTVLPTTTTLTGTTLTINFTSPLPRGAALNLTIGNITAPDGGHLITPYSLAFNVSGGPKVTSINIPSYKVDQGATIVVGFDSPLAAAQSTTQPASLTIGGKAVAAGISLNGSTITIKPTAALPHCTAFTVQVPAGLTSAYGVGGGSAYSFASRTICQVVSSIGNSVQGRPLTSYTFGTGPSKIIYFGNMHGNEKSAKYTLDDWVNYLEANDPKIPANRTIIVIPSLNPDGFAANTRRNADNVDLNRNFPADDWTSSVVEPDGNTYPTGGGTAPLSEPESAALAAFVQAQNPRLVLSYHAVGGIVLPNGAADSISLAHTYDALSNVSYLAGNDSQSFFDYDATGAFEGWTNDHLGIATLVIELHTETSDEFSGNQAAMWAMATLP